jgi:hypothetical protein
VSDLLCTASKQTQAARSPRTRLRWVSCVLAVLSASNANNASAFSDPETYKLPPQEAGGGGRFFTGTPADGFGCNVCHEGGAPTPLEVTGLPLTGYQPGASYEITKISTETKLAAGAIRLPRFESMAPDELCSMEAGGFPPGMVHQTEDGRLIVSTIDCGSRRLRFLWTAPTAADGPLWFGAGFVSGDNDATPAGDGVTMVRVPLATSRGGGGETQVIAAPTCSASAPGGRAGSFAASSPLPSVVLLGLLGWPRRLRSWTAEGATPRTRA